MTGFVLQVVVVAALAFAAAAASFLARIARALT